MRPRDLVSEMVAKAMRNAKITPLELSKRSGISYRNVLYVLSGSAVNWTDKAKNGCRIDTLIALLSACGFELRMVRSK